jgi:hypothetical protein
MYEGFWDVKHLGTVGQWASALLTAGSLYLALYIILRDRRLRERTQADRVLAMLTYVSNHGLAPKFPVTLTVRNTSGLPIKGPIFVIQDKHPKRAVKDLRGFSLTEERAEQVSALLNEDRPPGNFLTIASLVSLMPSSTSTAPQRQQSQRNLNCRARATTSTFSLWMPTLAAGAATSLPTKCGRSTHRAAHDCLRGGSAAIDGMTGGRSHEVLASLSMIG